MRMGFHKYLHIIAYFTAYSTTSTLNFKIKFYGVLIQYKCLNYVRFKIFIFIKS